MEEIQLKASTKRRLTKYGTMLSTWDSVINNLLDHAERCDLYWSEKE